MIRPRCACPFHPPQLDHPCFGVASVSVSRFSEGGYHRVYYVCAPCAELLEAEWPEVIGAPA